MIRAMRAAEFGALEKFLYEAIYIPEDEPPPPREIIKRPELQVYIKNFGGQATDVCFVAEADKKNRRGVLGANNERLRTPR